MRRLPSLCLLPAAALAFLTAAPALDDAPVAATVTDASGKETSLTGVKFTAGVRRLGWLAGKAAPKGVLALEVREEHSTTFQKGVATLTPLECVESVTYAYDKQTVSVRVKGVEAPLVGTLQYRGLNVLSLEGVAAGAPTKAHGGTPKDGFRKAAFPSARPFEARTGRPALDWGVQIDQPKAGHPVVRVSHLQALYSFPGGVEILEPEVPLRKGGTIPLGAGLKKFEMVAVDLNTHAAVAEVATDGPDQLVVIPLVREQAGRTGALVGFVGESPHGWKLFPLHTIKSLAPIAPK